MSTTRRSFLRLLGIGVAAATTGAVAARAESRPTVIANDVTPLGLRRQFGDGRTYIYARAKRELRAGDIVSVDDVIVGVAPWATLEGNHTWLQVRGPAQARVRT